jgi:hypothetical protein
MEALRRARYKFPGRQKIIVSKKWGFTSLDRADYEALRAEHKVMPDGAYVQVSPSRMSRAVGPRHPRRVMFIPLNIN